MTKTPIPRRLRRIAERQHGRLTRTQLRDAGATRRQIERWMASGWLTREHRGVYVLGARPRDRTGVFAAALHALGPSAVLSFRSAGAIWLLLTGAVPVEVTVPPTTGRANRRRIRVHRAEVPAEHVTVKDGLRVTSLVRTILDLAAVLPPQQLARAFEQAQVRHHLTPEAVAIEVLCRGGRVGTPTLRSLLEGAVDPAAVASVLELRFLALCQHHGLPRPLVNVPLGSFVPDFRWPDAMVVVETDSRAFHSSVASRRRDAAKDAWLAEQGYVVIRLRWTDVTADTEGTANRIRAALDGAR
ncbi:hypothetical protein DSM112329_00381 [Paraconexibacter sp. AEG42_29]|uniref:DUF559 domain-containing protein n=1 Tax=Paraconexibacter sp. AEG42_29 TaxID=2997339 RepID=A0AAU7AQB7_9ACTN